MIENLDITKPLCFRNGNEVKYLTTLNFCGEPTEYVFLFTEAGTDILITRYLNGKFSKNAEDSQDDIINKKNYRWIVFTFNEYYKKWDLYSCCLKEKDIPTFNTKKWFVTKVELPDE